jgi:hypothetical protein
VRAGAPHDLQLRCPPAGRGYGLITAQTGSMGRPSAPKARTARRRTVRPGRAKPGNPARTIGEGTTCASLGDPAAAGPVDPVMLRPRPELRATMRVPRLGRRGARHSTSTQAASDALPSATAWRRVGTSQGNGQGNGKSAPRAPSRSPTTAWRSRAPAGGCPRCGAPTPTRRPSRPTDRAGCMGQCQQRYFSCMRLYGSCSALVRPARTAPKAGRYPWLATPPPPASSSSPPC